MLSLLAATPWLLPYYGLAKLARKEPDLAATPPVGGTPVSLVIPARNEAGTIERMLQSVLASAYAPLEVIVVDDRSTDDTAARVEAMTRRDPRLRLLRGAELPPGWYGKPWACHQGAQAATGTVLAFTDADTTHQPALLGHAVAALAATGAGLLTVAPKQVCGTAWERLVMPHFWFILGFRYHPGRVNAATRARDVVANGQFLMLARDTYEAIGGHAAVRSQVAEDLALAQRVVAAGRRVHLAFAETLIETRMYENLRQLVEGWSKNVYLGGRQTFPDEPVRRALAPLMQMTAMAFWLVPPLLLALAAAGLGGWWTGAAAIAVALSLAFWALIYFGMHLPLGYALGYPVGAAISLYIFARSAVRGARRVEWRGRTYSMVER